MILRRLFGPRVTASPPSSRGTSGRPPGRREGAVELAPRSASESTQTDPEGRDSGTDVGIAERLEFARSLRSVHRVEVIPVSRVTGDFGNAWPHRGQHSDQALG